MSTMTRKPAEEREQQRHTAVTAAAASVATAATFVVVVRTSPGALKFLAGPSQLGRALYMCRV